MKAPFAFTSDVWRPFTMVELTENMRQQGDRVSGLPIAKHINHLLQTIQSMIILINFKMGKK